jgi:hypothetical protein
MEIRVENDAGDPLIVDDGQTIDLGIQVSRLPGDEESYAFFRYNTTDNIWEEAGLNAACGPEGLFCTVSIQDMGWWAVALP